MTPHNTIRKRNAKVSSSKPTFEDVYAMEYVQKSLQTLILENSREYPLMAPYAEDIKQEMLIYLARSLDAFNYKSASIKTYCRSVLINGLRHARRYYLREMPNALSQAIQLDELIEAEEENPDMTITAEIKSAIEAYSDMPFDTAENNEAFNAALDELYPKDRKIAEKIMSGIKIRDIAKGKNTNLRYVYDYAIPHIRSAIKAHYF